MQKTQKKIILLIALVGMVALLLSGCVFLDKLEAWKSGVSEGKGEIQTEDPAAEPQQSGDTQEESGVSTVVEGEMKEVVLYFADAQGQGLKPVTVSIPKVEGIARAAINQLIAGPDASTGLLPTIPEGTLLRDINVRPDGLCIVDFSSQLTENHDGGVMGEELTVYSIVNTLTQFSSIDQVQIWVNGKEVDSIAGHMDVSEAMARNETMILP